MVEYEGLPLVRRVAQAAANAGADPVVVVVGASSDDVSLAVANIPRVLTCLNSDWESGIASSIRVGLKKVEAESEADAVLLALADQPFISASDLQVLIAGFVSGSRLVASSYDGLPGVPAIIGKEFFNALRALKGDAGAGRWLRMQGDAVKLVSTPTVSRDMDTEDDVRLLND